MSDPAEARVRIREIHQALEEVDGLLLALIALDPEERDENSDAKRAVRGAISRAQQAAGCETIM
jgi:hypothetical protein